MVSSDFGKLDVQRHLSSGIDCAIAGFATAAAAMPTPAARRNSRRFIGYPPFGGAAPHGVRITRTIRRDLGKSTGRAATSGVAVRTPAARGHRSLANQA